ncbi:MAG: hypothetical protein JWM66_164 [Solirubrobacterales bacterium]|jgi:hypothetical protein|nr:hypothetical protein [Solirubrobacterales bacterium]
MYRRLLIPSLALAALALGGSASSSFGATAGGTAPQAAGPSVAMAAEKSSVEYTAAYTDSRFGPIECTGKHQTNSLKFPGTASSGGRDIFTCKSTEFSGAKRLPLQGVAPEEALTWGEGAWASDYFNSIGYYVVDVSGSGKVSKTGKTFHAVMYY